MYLVLAVGYDCHFREHSMLDGGRKSGRWVGGVREEGWGWTNFYIWNERIAIIQNELKENKRPLRHRENCFEAFAIANFNRLTFIIIVYVFFCVIRSENCNCMKIKRLLFVIRLIFFQNERIQFSLKVFEYYYFSIRSPMTISEFQKLLFRMKRKHSKYKIN